MTLKDSSDLTLQNNIIRSVTDAMCFLLGFTLGNVFSWNFIYNQR